MKPRYSTLAALAVLAAPGLLGCMGASGHAKEVQDATAGDRLTVGVVQREIRHGMSGSEVAAVLGSPNIVSTDESRREVWIYDKIATDHVYSTEQGGVSALVFGGGVPAGALVGGGVGSSYGRGAGAATTSQRTLTVIIKFDEAGTVRDFAYHTSRF